MKHSRRCQSVAVSVWAVWVASIAPLCIPLSGCNEAEDEARLAALELVDVALYWAVRGQDQEKNNFIHPVIRFRVLNGGESDVDYVQAMAVFKRESFPDEPWGNDFIYSISELPISSGTTSESITLRCDTNFVSKDAPEQMFENEKFERVDVEVFLRVGASGWKSALRREVPKQIGAPGLERFLDPEGEDAPVDRPRSRL